MSSKPIQRLCVYCGSSLGARDQYREAADALGHALAARGIELVYGGGHVGLMGALADGVLAAGGRVTGVIPRALMDRELGHTGIQDLRVVADMHERKMTMAGLADAFIALPGGWGTIEELSEMLTWLQLAIHAKPIGILNIAGYYDPFLAFAEAMITERFVRIEHRQLFSVDTNPETLIDRLMQPMSAPVDKWVDFKPAMPD
jgi:uncharacterized protein (TIGR00730 family)